LLIGSSFQVMLLGQYTTLNGKGYVSNKGKRSQLNQKYIFDWIYE